MGCSAFTAAHNGDGLWAAVNAKLLNDGNDRMMIQLTQSTYTCQARVNEHRKMHLTAYSANTKPPSVSVQTSDSNSSCNCTLAIAAMS